jgi:hypothetical protein
LVTIKQIRKFCRNRKVPDRERRVNHFVLTVPLAPVIDVIRQDGHTSLRAIASELNARGMMTRQGGVWHVSNVRNLLQRVDRSASV